MYIKDKNAPSEMMEQHAKLIQIHLINVLGTIHILLKDISDFMIPPKVVLDVLR